MASTRTPSSFRKMGISVKNSSSGHDNKVEAQKQIFISLKEG